MNGDLWPSGAYQTGESRGGLNSSRTQHRLLDREDIRRQVMRRLKMVADMEVVFDWEDTGCQAMRRVKSYFISNLKVFGVVLSQIDCLYTVFSHNIYVRSGGESGKMWEQYGSGCRLQTHTSLPSSFHEIHGRGIVVPSV
jgi:hypothetical protein